MVPTHAEVVRQRHFLAAILRALGIVMIVLSTLPFGSWLLEGISDGDLLDMSYYFFQVFMGVALIIVGSAITLRAGSFSRILLPLIKTSRCPNCRYSLDDLADPVCPECGLSLSAEFFNVDPPAPRQAPSPQADAVRWRYRISALIRVFALLFGIYQTWNVAWWVIYFFEFQADTTWLYVTSAIQVLLSIGIGVLLFLHSDRIARWCAPYPRVNDPECGSKSHEGDRQEA